MSDKPTESTAPVRKPRGRPFEAGKSPNPGGWSKEARAKRKAVAEALDEAFTVQDIVDGKPVTKDLLVEAIKLGVQEGEPALIRLACEYRYGKPVQPVDLSPESMADSDLRKAVVEIVEQWKQEGLTH